MDGGDWDGRLFDSLDELPNFAGDLVSADEENPAFKFYGRRFEVMDACDMLHHKRHRWWQPYCRRVFIALPIEESNSMHIIGSEHRSDRVNHRAPCISVVMCTTKVPCTATKLGAPLDHFRQEK